MSETSPTNPDQDKGAPKSEEITGEVANTLGDLATAGEQNLKASNEPKVPHETARRMAAIKERVALMSGPAWDGISEEAKFRIAKQSLFGDVRRDDINTRHL